MFRSVPLPPQVSGALHLHSMPGCFEAYDEARDAIVDARIAAVVCLNQPDELVYESPDYAAAIEAGIEEWEQINFPVPDHGTPPNWEEFLTLAQVVAARLEVGEGVLIHCYAGIGRTGTLACSVLLALGIPREEALRTVDACGAGPEGPGQAELVQWVAVRLGAEPGD